jgi:hypothetical protein
LPHDLANFSLRTLVVDEQALGQIGVIAHLDLDVEVELLIGAIEKADFEKFVDPLGPDF